MKRAKLCGKCGLTKIAACFHVHHQGTRGPVLQPWCKDCHRTAARESARRRYTIRAERDKARKRQRYWNEPGFKDRKVRADVIYKRRVRAAEREEAA